MADQEPFEATEWPEPFAGGPYLLVAVPESLEAIVPQNVTRFLIEWEEMLDPVRAVRAIAKEFVGDEDWRVGDWFAVPTFTSAGCLRQAARDEELLRRFKDSAGLLHVGDQECALSALVTDDDELDESGLSPDWRPRQKRSARLKSTQKLSGKGASIERPLRRMKSCETRT